MRRPVSTLGGGEPLEAAVESGVVGGAVLPDAPDDAEPGAAEDPDCVGVVVSAGAGALVDVIGPGVVVAAAVGEDADGCAQVFVAGPAEAGDFLFAGLDGDGRLAGDRLERDAGGVAFAAVTDLGEQLGGGDDALGVAEEREEDAAVVVGADGAGDLAGQELDLLDQGLERGDECEDDGAAGLELGLAGAAFWRRAEPGEQLVGASAAAVAVAGQEAGESLRAEAAGVAGAWVALAEGEADRRVDVAEDSGSAGPEGLELRAAGYRARPSARPGPRGRGSAP